MQEEKTTQNIEREILIVNTKIKICVDCCRGCLTGETESILAKIAGQALAALYSDEKNKNTPE